MNKEDFDRLDKLAADTLNEIGNEDFDRVDKLKIGQLLRINKTFIDATRQLTIANEIATRQHQIEYALAFQKNDKINYEVDPPIDIATKVTKEDSIKCLNCDFIADETEFQILDKRGDYLKCPKCGAKDDRLSNSDDPLPADDALVEAVKELMSDLECYCPENVAYKGLCGFCRVKAAHEKAVT